MSAKGVLKCDHERTRLRRDKISSLLVTVCGNIKVYSYQDYFVNTFVLLY